MRKGWLSSNRSPAATRRRLYTTRFTPRSTRWISSSARVRRSRSTASTADPVHLHEAVRWIVHSSDQLGGVLVEPQVEARTVGSDVGRVRIKVVAHARIHQDYVRSHARQTLI